jgi:hypothetical protein
MKLGEHSKKVMMSSITSIPDFKTLGLIYYKNLDSMTSLSSLIFSIAAGAYFFEILLHDDSKH